MPRFQFTIRELLWATFWVAVSCAAWNFGAIGPPTPYRGVALCVLFVAPLPVLFSVFGRSHIAPGIWIVWVATLLLLSIARQ